MHNFLLVLIISIIIYFDIHMYKVEKPYIGLKCVKFLLYVTKYILYCFYNCSLSSQSSWYITKITNICEDVTMQYEIHWNFYHILTFIQYEIHSNFYHILYMFVTKHIFRFLDIIYKNKSSIRYQDVCSISVICDEDKIVFTSYREGHDEYLKSTLKGM